MPKKDGTPTKRELKRKQDALEIHVLFHGDKWLKENNEACEHCKRETGRL